jgi:nitronate monooxygenase
MHLDRRFQELVGIELPILLAPMAGPATAEAAVAVAEAGGLGSLPCALLSDDLIRAGLGIIRQRTRNPVNLNFFCHKPARFDAAREAGWRERLRPYYVELGLDPDADVPSPDRKAFDAEVCEIVEEMRPEVVSFHFGLPDQPLLDRVKAPGAKVVSSATTVPEARWLAEHGCDAVIAQGFEAGGHRGMFLSDDLSTQLGTMALVPQVVDAVSVPVIAAGGISDARGIVAAFALGASAVQIGTAYLRSPEMKVPALHRAALDDPHRNEATALTNLFTGRPARGIVNRLMREAGPVWQGAPEFPLAGGALAPLRTAAEGKGSPDFMSLWSGQAGPLGAALPAGELTRKLWADVQAMIAAA